MEFVPVRASGMISDILASAFIIHCDLYLFPQLLFKEDMTSESPKKQPHVRVSPLLPHVFGASLLDMNTLSSHTLLTSHDYQHLHYLH